MCRNGDSLSPSFLFYRATRAGQRSAEWSRLVTDGENSQVAGLVVPGCLVGKQRIFCICKLGSEGIVPHLGGHPTVFVFLFMLVGRGTAVGPQSGERCWPLLDRLWRAIASLMKPWCAEGDVPTAANLNLYRRRSSHVGWHSDDEPLCGERGEAKLIVSVSFGTQALFKWKGNLVQAMRVTRAGLAMVMSLSWMANARTSSVIVRIPVRIRNGLTSRSVGSSNMLLPVPFLGQEWHVVCQRVRRVHLFLSCFFLGVMAFFVGFLVLLGALCMWEYLLCLFTSFMCTGLGLRRCAYRWTRTLGGGRWRHYLRDPRRVHWKCFQWEVAHSW